MIRAARVFYKIKYGSGRDPLKAPRRIKDYKYVYRPIMARDKMQMKKDRGEHMVSEEEWLFAKSAEEHSQQIDYRTAGVVDPFLNELYLGRINQDWLNPFPTLEDDRETIKLSPRRGDLADRLVDIEELEDNALEKLTRLGVMNLDHHHDIGGVGMSEMEAMHVTEVLSKDLSLLTTFKFAKNFGIKALLYGASDEVLGQYMEDCTALKRTIGWALCEPEARSDISSIQTRAFKDPDGSDHWIISGKKSRVLVHPNTDLFVVFAQTQRTLDEPAKLTAFLVDLQNTQGSIEVTSGDQDISIDGLKFANVVFQDVVCPGTHILGELGEGFHLAFTLQSLNRYSVGAEFAEIQRSLLQLMTKYVHITEQFGKKLSEFPLVKQRISRITENAYMSESLSYMVAGKLTEIESGSDFSLYASECNAVQLKCKELAIDSITNCIELLGTRALAPNSRVILDQLVNVYAIAAMSGSSDVLSLFIGQSGFQFRFHFDTKYFTMSRGSNVKSTEYRKRYWLRHRDEWDEISNFTDSWKTNKSLGMSPLNPVSAFTYKTGASKWYGRGLHFRKLTGILGGRYSKHTQLSGEGDYAAGWIESMLGGSFDDLMRDVDDFGRRLSMILQIHGSELEHLQVPLKRSSDVAVNLFTMCASLSRANKSIRLGYNYYEDECALAQQIIRRYRFENKLRMHEFMPWNLKNSVIDPSTEHIGKQVISAGRYPYQPAIALGFNFEENPAYLDKLDELRSLNMGDAAVVKATRKDGDGGGGNG